MAAKEREAWRARDQVIAAHHQVNRDIVAIREASLLFANVDVEQEYARRVGAFLDEMAEAATDTLLKGLMRAPKTEEALWVRHQYAIATAGEHFAIFFDWYASPAGKQSLAALPRVHDWVIRYISACARNAAMLERGASKEMVPDPIPLLGSQQFLTPIAIEWAGAATPLDVPAILRNHPGVTPYYVGAQKVMTRFRQAFGEIK